MLSNHGNLLTDQPNSACTWTLQNPMENIWEINVAWWTEDKIKIYYVYNYNYVSVLAFSSSIGSEENNRTRIEQLVEPI